MFNIYTTPITSPVRKTSRGKIHQEGCGNGQYRTRPIKGTVGKTYAELINQYGDALCKMCFGKAVAKMQEDNR